MLFDPEIRDGKGFRDEHSELYFLELRNNFLGLKILKFFYVDPDPGSFWLCSLDPGWKNSDRV